MPTAPTAAVSAQIVFVTLFLGLVSGSQPVEVAVEGTGVERVEFLLDGRPAGRLEAPPWRGPIDFGAELRPARLQARGYAADGSLLAQASQWVNLSRPPAELDLLVERDAAGRPVAVRPVWGSLVPANRPELTIHFDGEPLAVDPAGRAPLPRFDAAVPHLLAAEIRFASGIVARRDLALGGEWLENAAAELTAVAVVPPPASPRGGRRDAGPGEAAAAASVAGALVLSGGGPAAAPPRAAALEKGEGQVILVRGASAVAAAERLGRVAQRPTKSPTLGAGPGFDPGDPGFSRFEYRLEGTERVRLLSPYGATVPGASLPTRLFDFSRDFTARDGGFLWLLTSVGPAEAPRGSPRLADAVAVAGLQAMASHRRRAVVLVLGEEASDPSVYEPAVVRRYLETLRVPLVVWVLGDSPLAPAWGGGLRVRRQGDLRRAVRELEAVLEAQRILWIEGVVSPTEIALRPEALAAGFRWPGG